MFYLHKIKFSFSHLAYELKRRQFFFYDDNMEYCSTRIMLPIRYMTSKEYPYLFKIDEYEKKKIRDDHSRIDML